MKIKFDIGNILYTVWCYLYTHHKQFLPWNRSVSETQIQRARVSYITYCTSGNNQINLHGVGTVKKGISVEKPGEAMYLLQDKSVYIFPLHVSLLRFVLGLFNCIQRHFGLRSLITLL